MCSSSFKKKLTLQKHKNTKHYPNYCSPKKKIGKGRFGYAFDVRPGQEAAAESLRLEWVGKKKDDNNLNEKEKNLSHDKYGRDDHENSKEIDFLDAEEYFQIEIVDGETVYVCNICNEGQDNENEFTKHIKDNHESLMNDDSYSDTDIYEGFDEEGHRIV